MASYLETVREWFRARLDAPGGLSTPEGAALGLRVLAIWRSRMIARALGVPLDEVFQYPDEQG